jgi:heme exporter protein A
VIENLRFSARLAGGGDDVEAALTSMGLADCAGQTGRTLSAGQRKRTALSRLMLVKAKLWLLDEPYTNLDAGGIDQVDQLLQTHLSARGACVMSTHGNHRPAAVGESQQRTLDLGPVASAYAA